MGRKLIRLILFLAVLGLVLWLARVAGYWGSDPDRTLSIFGNVEVREAELGFRVPGRIAELYVDEGEAVDAGAVLARLDPRPFEDAVSNASADVAVVSAQLQQQRNGNRPQDIAAARAALEEARAGRDEAARQYRRRNELLGRGFIPVAEVDAAKAALAAAEARVEAAEQALSLQQAGTRPDEIARTAASSAAAEARRRQALTSLSDTQLVAPSAGVISTRVRENGTIVQAGEPVLILALVEPVRIRAFVAQPDLQRIQPGMGVHIYVDGRDKPYNGTIGFIAPTAEFTPKTVQTESQRTDLVYRVRINVTDSDGRLRQGQPVTVRLKGEGRPPQKQP